ncbi:MAG: Crp/Fnr family transcriptional regulator [Chitinophagaceae bacterium]|nr:Crp/Fnr family transcriptional regulator [Chitinophagaceae bacterium]
MSSNIITPGLLSIKQFIHNHVDRRFTVDQDLAFKTSLASFKRHEIITPYGAVENYGYYLLEGLVKISTFREDGEERILDFFMPGQFFSSYYSFLFRETSDVQVTAMRNCRVECIHYNDIMAAYEDDLISNKFGRIVTQYYYGEKTKREKQFLKLSAEQRYQILITMRPDLVALLKHKDIALYLGIKPGSLSRIINPE